ncbi:ribonucleoside diphosphate reductase [Burkholderia phage BcepSauron]|uniref:Ribonucleoside diphosphate reductase n=1 Tax=Burkholderia phage BcepSauron TaxID=2530033 RepID=A0A482MKU6_9CAUD|nr:hypothetical protein H1O17_gp291 [Burkholderia phage BcepSauron]QBQ74671.1 ribonucleoside diphosphate reductase [Burkholderia phage BcepSauron]
MNHPLVRNQKDEYDVYIGRPSRWGNPFSLEGGTRKQVLALHRKWIDGLIEAPCGTRPPTRAEIRRELRGKRLGCFCRPRACHGDYLAEIANASTGGGLFANVRKKS